MRMLPASTSSPPNFLTPKRLECESRPLRVLPPAFLCAIWYLLALSDDRRDFHVGVGLPMRLLALVVLAPAKLHDPHLVALAVRLDGRRHLGGSDVGRAQRHAGTCTDQQDLVEFNAGAL